MNYNRAIEIMKSEPCVCMEPLLCCESEFTHPKLWMVENNKLKWMNPPEYMKKEQIEGFEWSYSSHSTGEWVRHSEFVKVAPSIIKLLNKLIKTG